MTDDFWKDAEVIHAYTAEDAIADGMLVEVFKERWPELSGGKPILSTPGPYNAFSTAALIEIWNEYVTWVREEAPQLPEEERMFSTTMNSQTVWVIEDANAFTMMFPDEY